MADAPYMVLAGNLLDVLTGTVAMTAYGVVAGLGVVVAVAAKIGPRLFRHFWRYVDDEEIEAGRAAADRLDEWKEYRRSENDELRFSDSEWKYMGRKFENWDV